MGTHWEGNCLWATFSASADHTATISWVFLSQMRKLTVFSFGRVFNANLQERDKLQLDQCSELLTTLSAEDEQDVF